MSRYLLILILFILITCTKSTDRIDAALNSPSGQALKSEILTYVNTIDTLNTETVKQQSLIYSLNDYSFYTVRYITHSKASLYVEHGKKTNNRIENKYYVKGGRLMLAVQKSFNPLEGFPYNEIRTYYKNGEPLFSEQRSAPTEAGRDTTGYIMSDMTYNASEEFQKLEDAINQRGKFDLTFQGITENPKARYLILSRKAVNAHRAALFIDKEDQLIKAILADPEKFRGRKLKINWALRDDMEAVYRSGRLAN